MPSEPSESEIERRYNIIRLVEIKEAEKHIREGEPERSIHHFLKAYSPEAAYAVYKKCGGNANTIREFLIESIGTALKNDGLDWITSLYVKEYDLTEKNKIVPAILTDNKNEFVNMLNLCSTFTSYVHVDIMDGKFVPSKSIGIEDLKGIRHNLRSEAHLMVDEPSEWIYALKDFGAEKVFSHFEAKKRDDIIEKTRKSGLSVGLAINPDTEIDDFKYLVDEVDAILFMSVVPGQYGSKFIPQVLDKVKEFKRQYPSKIIGIDGGIKISNVRDVYRLGIDNICVGSAILKADSPMDEYRKFFEMRYG
jgi:ribulose-phosphate 3-epimerase